MAMKRLRCILAVTAVLVATMPSPARADEPQAEIGASLASVMIGLANNGGTIVGLPSAGFGILNPGVYASFFVGPRVAIEPQLGFIWVSGDRTSNHILNLAGQVDYFAKGINDRSAYVFGSVGLIDVSGRTPKSVSGGIGYRIPVGDRLTFRVDGRVTHVTTPNSDALMFAVSIGGLFGRR